MRFTFADLPVSGRVLAITRENYPEKDQMVKCITYLFTSAVIFSSCSGLKPLAFTNNKPAAKPESGAVALKKPSAPEKKEIKFLDDISASTAKTVVAEPEKKIEIAPLKKETPPSEKFSKPNVVESASALQLKYAILLNTDVENVPNTELLQKIDEWYGTRYCMGGTTSKCIDCSAFMQILCASVYGISLPRTARDQYKMSTRISRTELREGDLVFFNTRGGVSHVGLYIQNNKFVHASTNGVKISDLFDPYYLKRFIGVGRIEKPVGSR